MTGPSIRPRPKAVPTSPMALARRWGALTSAINADATGRLPAMTPPKALAAYSIQSSVAAPNMP